MTEPTLSQVFLTVADLVADQGAPGGNEATLFQKCRDASDYLQKEIGHFIPVTRTLHLAGDESAILHVPPLLAALSLEYLTIPLIADTDYLLRPEQRRWPYGPYTWLEKSPYSARGNTWLPVNISSTQPKPVELTGRFGLYDRSVSVETVVADPAGQSDSQTTLTVDHGGAVSPGMQLLIEDEQQLVTAFAAPQASGAVLDGAMATPTETELTLDDATKVHVGEVLRFDFEQVRILDLAGNDLYVTRGWNKTQARAHNTATPASVYRTVKVERGLNGTAAAAHATDVALARYAVPDDILFLAKEIATLMLNKALSGYQGRTGNDQGVVFYNDAFPRDDLARIKQLYSIPEAA